MTCLQDNEVIAGDLTYGIGMNSVAMCHAASIGFFFHPPLPPLGAVDRIYNLYIDLSNKIAMSMSYPRV